MYMYLYTGRILLMFNGCSLHEHDVTRNTHKHSLKFKLVLSWCLYAFMFATSMNCLVHETRRLATMTLDRTQDVGA